VFKSKFDGTLKTSLKNSLTVVDALDSEPIRQIWEVIETKSAALAAASSPVVDLTAIQELDVGDDDLVVMSAVFAADRLEAMSAANRDLVKDAAEGAKRIVAAGVRLIDGEDKESTLIAAIRDGPISRIQGGSDGYVTIIYDLKSSGEDPSDPFRRSAPLRKSHVDRMTRVALKARSPTVEDEVINPGDVWVTLDDGRPSIIKQLHSGLKLCPKVVKVLHIISSEDAIVARRKSLSAVGQARNRGFMTLRQVECAHFISAADCTKLQKRSNLHFEGTSSGDALVTVGAPDLLRDGWMMTVAEKRVLMGEGRAPLDLVDCRGEDGDDGDEVDLHQSAAKRPKRGDQEMVPFNMSQMLPELYAEILHRTGAKAVIDLTASDGVLALACLAAGTPYLGICHNAQHIVALLRRIQSQVFGQLSDESKPFYNGSLAALLADDPAQEVASTATAKGKSRAKPSKSSASKGKTAKAIKSAARRTTKAKKTAKAKVAKGDVDGEDGGGEESEEEESDPDSEGA